MSIIIGLLTFILVVNSALLILLVLMQLPKKEAGLGTAFGATATDSLFGAETGNILTKATKICATIFLVLSLSLSVIYAHRSERRNLDDDLTSVVKTDKPAPAPAAAPAKATPAAPVAEVKTEGEMSVETKAVAPAPAETAPAPAPATNAAPAVPAPDAAQPKADAGTLGDALKAVVEKAGATANEAGAQIKESAKDVGSDLKAVGEKIKEDAKAAVEEVKQDLKASEPKADGQK